VIGKAFWDVEHAPKDQSNRRKRLPQYAVWKMALHVVQYIAERMAVFCLASRHAILYDSLMKTTTLASKDSMSRSPLRHGLFLTALTLACFALSPRARATCQDACLTNNNTVQGDDALISLTSGSQDTAIGFAALFSDTTGFQNTAIGYHALWLNTTGNYNTAIGGEALQGNSTGDENTAIGHYALYSNTGSSNTATGRSALFANTTGNDNTATGDHALWSNTTGVENTATGHLALRNNQTGNGNTATGEEALFFNTTGINNTAHGASALYRNTTGNNNIALGVSAGFNLTTGDNNIYIGNAGNNGEHNKIRIGTIDTHKATFIAGISGVTVPAGVGVIVGADGKLGTVVSSARFKEAIKPMDKASAAILALQPVTFRYKKEIDADGTPQFGLVAEDVEKVNPDLVARDEQGKPYTVRYEAVNAMLLNEFLKEHRKVGELEAKLAKQEKEFSARFEEQDSKIQQVSAQLELSRSTPQTVAASR
jgi:Chaperone of endosialidase